MYMVALSIFRLHQILSREGESHSGAEVLNLLGAACIDIPELLCQQASVSLWSSKGFIFHQSLHRCFSRMGLTFYETTYTFYQGMRQRLSAFARFAQRIHRHHDALSLCLLHLAIDAADSPSVWALGPRMVACKTSWR